MPYEVYRATHLAHHCDERLTDPIDDPESFYLAADTWARLGPLARWVLRANNRLIGRLLLGPALTLGRFWASQARAIPGSAKLRQVWLTHGAGVATVLLWAVGICGIPLWAYLLLFVYPGVSLTLLRSFAEHRAVPDPGQRTTVVEAGPLFGLLYLNNNLHVAHHASPEVPWHELPAVWREARARLLAPGPVYRGYSDIAARFLLREIDSPVHPLSPSPVAPDSAPA
jgi:fatty acid desaturase